MKLYVAVFPDLKSNFSWIEEFRTKHDPAAQFIEPHMTLVFPTTALSEAPLIDEISSLVKEFERFRVILRSAIVMPETETSGRHAHVFLVPDEGFSHLVLLHDLLYSGKLKSQLRLDIPFLPHLTVAAGVPPEAAKALTDSLNSKRFVIEFTVEAVSVVNIEDHGRDRKLSAPIMLGR